MKKTLKDFLNNILTESKKDDVKYIDCTLDDLTDEEREFCRNKKLLDFVKYVNQANN